MGLGVHCVIYPDGNGFASGDGQKDVCAFLTGRRFHSCRKTINRLRANRGEKDTGLDGISRRTGSEREANGSMEGNYLNRRQVAIAA